MREDTRELEHTRDQVLAKARQIFPNEDFSTIVAVLDAVLEDRKSVRERVQLAILKLSDGDVDRLLHFVGVANSDWRDVLLWAEYPNADKAQHEQTRLKNESAAKGWRDKDREQYLEWLNGSHVPPVIAASSPEAE